MDKNNQIVKIIIIDLVSSMVEKGAIMTREETEQDVKDLRDFIAYQLRDAKVDFPIKSKDELSRIYPKGTPQSCSFRGRTVSIHDIIPTLEDSNFPIRSADEAADLLTSRCSVMYPEVS